MKPLRKISFGKDLTEKLDGSALHLSIRVTRAIDENLQKRDKQPSYLQSDNEIFIPLIDTFVMGSINFMDSFYLNLSKTILSDNILPFEDLNLIKVNKEYLYYTISMASIRCGDEIAALTYWELAQKEHENTYGLNSSMEQVIYLLKDKFRSVLEPIIKNYNANTLIATLRPNFNFINDFETILFSLSDLNRGHFLSCGLKQVHLLHKLRTYPNLDLIKIFAQELVNSLCLLNENLLKSKGLSGSTINPLMEDVTRRYTNVGVHLGLSNNSSGLYSISKSQFYNNYSQFIAYIFTITDKNELMANVLYALHRLRNDALHSLNSSRAYYNNPALFEITIGLLFVSVSVIGELS